MGINRFSRRRFLKAGLTCLAGTAVKSRPQQAQPSDRASQAVSRSSLKKLTSIPTTCQQCPSGCGIIAYLNGDRCVQLLGNPTHPVNRGAICAKGIAGLNLVYDQERVLFPLKRSGKRGQGEWTRITWDEAYHLLLSRLGRPPFSRQDPRVVFDVGRSDPLLARMISSLGVPFVIKREELRRSNLELAYLLTTGFQRLIPDVGRSRTVLNFGANPLAQHDHFLGLAPRMIEAMVENGSKLYTFDVRMSETAAKSTAWFPVRPGTDAAVALSMSYVILKKNLADREFFSRMTNTSLQNLEKHLSKFPPERAEEISGVRSEWIEETASIFASQKPSVALAGAGVADHINGIQNVRCVLLLNWMVGNIGSKGGLSGPSQPFSASASHTEETAGKRLMGTNELVGKQSEIDFYFAYLSNPAFEESACRNIERYLLNEDRIRFLAVMDTHLSETAILADLVLPSATPLESWGLDSSPTFDQGQVLNLRQPVVSLMSPARMLRSPDFETGKITDLLFRPRGEAKEIGSLCIDMAQRLGGQTAQLFPFKSTKEFISLKAAKNADLMGSGGIQALKEKGFWINKRGENRQTVSESSSRRTKIDIAFEFSSEKTAPGLPDFEEIRSHKNKDKEELILTSYKTALIDKSTANSKWLREISHENRLWINRKTAGERGIKNGDTIEVSSSSGSLVTRALVTDRIHPESVALAEGFGHRATGCFARARITDTKDRDTSLIWWGKDGQGANSNEIIGLLKANFSGSYVSKDTLVRIKKIKTEV